MNYQLKGILYTLNLKINDLQSCAFQISQNIKKILYPI